MEFKWMNESSHTIEDNRIEIFAPEKSDFFLVNPAEVNPDLPAGSMNAPFCYTEIEGNFVMTVRASLDFQDTYDSACAMVMQSEDVWAKCCYEFTDYGACAAVSVVTKGDSDDANGEEVGRGGLWLKICRAGNYFTFHYSEDGANYRMLRFFHLPADPVIKVGLAAQAPVGKGGVRVFENLLIEKKTVKNLRAGI